MRITFIPSVITVNNAENGIVEFKFRLREFVLILH